MQRWHRFRRRLARLRINCHPKRSNPYWQYKLVSQLQRCIWAFIVMTSPTMQLRITYYALSSQSSIRLTAYRMLKLLAVENLLFAPGLIARRWLVLEWVRMTCIAQWLPIITYQQWVVLRVIWLLWTWWRVLIYIRLMSFANWSSKKMASILCIWIRLPASAWALRTTASM